MATGQRLIASATVSTHKAIFSTLIFSVLQSVLRYKATMSITIVCTGRRNEKASGLQTCFSKTWSVMLEDVSGFGNSTANESDTSSALLPYYGVCFPKAL